MASHLAPHEIPTDLDIIVVDHPLAAARLSTMRDARTDNSAFRTALRELTLMLIYEASRTLEITKVPIHTPVARTSAIRLSNPPLLVPVLRAGLGMADQAHALIPEAQMGFVGLARNEETLQPTPYMESRRRAGSRRWRARRRPAARSADRPGRPAHPSRPG